MTASETQNIVEEVTDNCDSVVYTGYTKWFNDKLGYGFITICDGNEKGKDIFVHHSGIKPLNSNYKTLRKGEYIQFAILNGKNGNQAINVTGIKGGPLMCDYATNKRVDWQRQSLPITASSR
jgi:cold shock CspA family protein